MQGLPRPIWLSAALVLATAQARAQYHSRVVMGLNGAQPNGFVGHAALSDDGRHVVFDSPATNLVPGDTTIYNDVFHVDRQTGAVQLVAASMAGGVPASGAFLYYDIALTPDGRFALFAGGSDDFTPGDTNQSLDLFLRDLQTGVTTRVSVGSGGVQGNGASSGGSLSDDGRFVAFMTWATNLFPGDTNGGEDVLVRDLATGNTTLESVDAAGTQGSARSWNPDLSADGRWITFISSAPNLVAGDTNQAADIFLRDRLTGAIERVNADPNQADGVPSGAYQHPRISADGSRVAFTDTAANLVAGDTNGVGDAFVRDRVTQTTMRVSVRMDGVEADASCFAAAISSDGRYVSFVSRATNLVIPPMPPLPANQYPAYLKDTLTGELILLSQREDGVPVAAHGAVTRLQSGRFVALPMTDLGGTDTNGSLDLYVVDLDFLPIRAFCAGDGLPAGCPCGNQGAPLHGCANSVRPEGALLSASGTCGLAAETLRFDLAGLTGSACTLYQGDASQAPAPLDDGIGCIGGTLVRLGTLPIAAGTSSSPAPGGPPVSVRGAVPPQGGTRFYQTFYRNVAPLFCPPATTNRTNGVVVRWVP